MLTNGGVRARGALLLASILAPACADDAIVLDVPAHCQPLFAGTECLLPYPSDFFLTDDATMPSGHAVRVELPARPIVVETKADADPNAIWAPDGFSTLATITALLGGPVSPTGLVALAGAPGDTTTAAARTLIVDATTGALIPHFVDLDGRATDPARQAIVLHPLAPLAEKTRYVVALRGVEAPGGGLAIAPEGFRRLRDRDVASAPALEAIAARHEAEVFAPLAALGVPRGELQLAWSFTTGSRARPLSDMLEIRRLTEAWLATHTPTVSITSVEEGVRAETWRTIQGEIEAPLFLDDPLPGGRIARDAAGRVEQRGTTRVAFTMHVPRSVRDGFGPGPLLAFGHGFFGGQVEVTQPGTRRISEALGLVVVGIDWVGMTQADVFLVVEGLVSHPSTTLTFVERTHQAMANWIVTTRALQGPLAALPAMRRPTAAGQPGVTTSSTGESNAGAPIYDATTPAFMGISQGHILAGVLAAVHPDLQRVTMQVGGAGFSLLMSRARPFAPFLAFMESSLPDRLEQQKFIALAQTQLDRIDPGLYAAHVLREPLPGNAPRRVLLQIGLGDVQVPNLGAWLHARALGVPLLTPAPLPIAGLTEAPGPIEGSALATFDFGVDLSVYDRAAPPDLGNPVHDRLRGTAPALEQLGRFVREGVVVHPCGAEPCRVE